MCAVVERESALRLPALVKELEASCAPPERSDNNTREAQSCVRVQHGLYTPELFSLVAAPGVRRHHYFPPAIRLLRLSRSGELSKFIFYNRSRNSLRLSGIGCAIGTMHAYAVRAGLPADVLVHCNRSLPVLYIVSTSATR